MDSPLSAEAEQAITDTIGAAMAVHTELGPGFLERIYLRAMCLELEARNIAFERERPIRVIYRHEEIPGQRVDLIIRNLIVVELKVVERFDEIHPSQVVSYLRTLGLRGGLLVNFRVTSLRQGLRRVVL